MNFPGVLFLTIFTLFWSGITLTFDGLISAQAWQRWQATGFPIVTGRVTLSEVAHSRGSKGSTTYRPNIHFTYEVAGRRFTGQQYQFGEWSTSGSSWARAAVKAHPAGSEVAVHYEPNKPEVAVISVGFDGSELFLAMFMMPFNAVMLGLWSVPVTRVKRWLMKPEAGGAKIRQRFGHTSVRLVTFPAWAAGGGAVALASFAGMFVLGFATGFHPTLGVTQAAWAVVLGVGLAAFAWRLIREQRGMFDLVIDAANETISLPQNCGRKTPVVIATREVCGVEVALKVQTSSKGGTTTTYLPTLVTRAGERYALVEWYTEASARQFSGWLRKTLGLAELP